MDEQETAKPESGEMPVDRKTNHINISGDTVMQRTAEYPEEHRAMVRWLFNWAKEENRTWSDLQAAVKINSTTLWKVWNDKYRDTAGERVDLGSLCAKIERFKTLAEARANIRRLPFVETSVWRRVSKVCLEALHNQDIAFIYGESQIGKTACLREFERRYNHGQTTYVLMPASAGVQSMMREIAEALHISSRTSFEQLRGRVANALDGSRLLLIDEVHECFVSYQKSSMVKSLNVLRQLQETTKCGMVLCGTNVFRHEIERGEFAQALKQLRRRGIWELQLESVPTDGDLALIARHYRLPAPDEKAQELVGWIAAEMGLGKYTKFLARASEMASQKRETMTWEHFSRVVQIAETLRKAPGNIKGN